MRKLLSALLIVSLVFALAVPAFADVDGPIFREYDVVVTSLLGAVMYDEEYSDFNGGTFYMAPSLNVVPYDTVVTVFGEYSHDDTIYLSIEHNDKFGLIKSEDVVMLKESMTPQEGYKLDSKETVYLYLETNIYKGPAKAYDKLSTVIPADTVVSFQYVNAEDYSWAYVNYQGAKGWIYVYSHTTASGSPSAASEFDTIDVPYRIGKLLVIKPAMALHKSPDTDSPKVVTNLPAGTESTYVYAANNDTGNWSLLTYNGKTGWLLLNGEDSMNVAYGYKDYSVLIINENGVEMYSEPSSTSKLTGDTIAKGTVLDCDFKYDEWCEQGIVSWYRVSSGGKVGWIPDEAGVAEKETNIMKAEAPVKLYAEPRTSSQVLATLAKGNTFNTEYHYIDEDSPEYDYWYRTTINSVSGWVCDRDEYRYIADYVPVTEVTSPEGDTTQESSAVSEQESTAAAGATTASRGLTPRRTAVVCVSAAVAVAITAAVVIILTNKKKKAA